MSSILITEFVDIYTRKQVENTKTFFFAVWKNAFLRLFFLVSSQNIYLKKKLTVKIVSFKKKESQN